jgi:peptidoglycan/xylan/chitin deacetylase (PgdA/CDA1 family)
MSDARPRLLGLKIDIDTYVGCREGLPYLVDALGRYGWRASLFVPGGPDRSGLAVVRVLTQPGYLGKLLRTRALSVYGARTALSGLLLSGGRVTACAGLLSEALAAGHEVGVHGHDHTRWHNRLHAMSWQEVEREITLGFDAVDAALRIRADSFAAPGWQAGFRSLMLHDRRQLRFASDTRGTHPFLPVVAGYRFRTPQVPTSLPTLDELPAGLPPRPADRDELFRQLRGQPTPVYTAHAELEGRAFRPFFEELLRFLAGEGIPAVPLPRLLAEQPGPLPCCELVQGSVPGRPGKVACQGPVAASV